MIFMQDDVELNLLTVLYFNETNAANINRMRGYSALSYRYESDAEIIVTSRRRDEPIRMAGGDLAFFPPDLSYFRKAAHDRMIVFHLGIPNYMSYDLEVKHSVGNDIGGLFEEAFRVWTEKRPGYRYSTASILYRIFAEVRAGLDNGKPEYSRMISDAIDYISHNYADQSLSVSRLADISLPRSRKHSATRRRSSRMTAAVSTGTVEDREVKRHPGFRMPFCQLIVSMYLSIPAWTLSFNFAIVEETTSGFMTFRNVSDIPPKA